MILEVSGPGGQDVAEKTPRLDLWTAKCKASLGKAMTMIVEGSGLEDRIIAEKRLRVGFSMDSKL